MLTDRHFPYSSMQEINLDWILTKVKNILRFVPDDGAVGQILRRTAHGAEWSDEQGGGGAVTSVNGQTGDVVLTIPDSTSDLINDSGFVDAAGAAAAAPVQKVNGQTGTVTINKTAVGLGNVQNVLQYSASNPPPYPVTSVNGQTGAVTVTVPTDTSDLNNDSGFVDAAGAAAAAPVQSVNGQTGSVSLSIPSLGYYYIVYNTPIQPGGTNINYSFSDLGIPDDETVLLVQIRQYHYGTLDDVYHSLFIGWTFNNVSRTISARIYSTRTNSANSQIVFEALTIK